MAIIDEKKLQCSLCGKVIDSQDEAIMFPNFLRNTHPLAKFSDAVVHKRCFQECAERANVELLLSRFKELMANAPLNCTLEEYESWLSEKMREVE